MTDVANLQDVIDAAGLDPEPAIVHLPSGRYYISETLRIGAGHTGDAAGTGIRG